MERSPGVPAAMTVRLGGAPASAEFAFSHEKAIGELLLVDTEVLQMLVGCFTVFAHIIIFMFDASLNKKYMKDNCMYDTGYLASC